MSSLGGAGPVGSEFGWYRIEALIGRGGMGDVYRAYDTKRDRVVALKLLANRAGDDGTFAERFRRECQVVARLGDPHVIPIHDYGEIGGTLYLDMRLVEGQTLRELIDRAGALDPARSLRIIDQVASALGAAHRAGIVHRDVKPENILLTDSDFAYLVDFGIAVVGDGAGDRLTRTGMAVGSTSYMAPEQFDGAAVTPATDVYSLTAVLYEMLTGQRAHGGGSVSEVLKSVLVGSVPPASAVRPTLPRGVDAALEHGLSLDPGARYRTPADMVAAVESGVHTPPSAEYAVTSLSPATVDPVRVTRAETAAGAGAVAGGDAESALGHGGHPGSGSSRYPGTQVYPGPPEYPAAPLVYPVPPSSPGRPNSKMPWLIGGGVAVVIVAVAVVVLVLVRGSSDRAEGAESSTADGAVSAQSEESGPTQTHTETRTVVSEPTVYRTPPGPYGVGLRTYKDCDPGPATAVYTGFETTSCGFATNVARQLASIEPDGRTLQLSAYSSEGGGQMHPITCRGATDGRGLKLWRCQGGLSGNAVVYVYP